MKTRLVRPWVLLLLLLLLASAGCKAQAASPAAETGIRLGGSDSGHALTMKIGDQFLVELEANPSTGYTWDIAEADPAILKQIGETEYRSASSTPMPGQAGTQVLRFEALGAGVTTLKLIYHRPWETGVPPLNTFTLQITVQ